MRISMKMQPQKKTYGSMVIASILMLGLVMPTFAMGQAILSGAGATFPSPLYRKWIDVYQTATQTRISYTETGSSGGIRLLKDRQVDFGATDAFLSDDEMAFAGNGILHVPTCLGAVAVICHLPGKPIVQLSGTLAADIFTGRANQWNDPRIVEENPHTAMPALPITVVHRSDGSGTTFIFTDYLAKTSAPWRKSIGRGKRVPWATGIGVEGNPGVADLVKRIPGAIGYVSLNYAQKNSLPVARIKNRSGRYIEPTAETVSAAAHKALPNDMRLMLTDTSAPAGYPISAFTYLIVYTEQAYANRSLIQANALNQFLWWVIHDGQKYTRQMFYAPLPPEAIALSEKVVGAMTFRGKPLWK